MQKKEEANGGQKWFEVTLRLMGDNLLLDEVENNLNIKPSFTGRKGEHINLNPKYAKNQTNLWNLSFTTDSSIAFEQQIEELLQILEPKKSELKEILSVPGVEGELFLGFSSSSGQGGAHFSPSLLSRIGALGLAVNLDLYPPSREEG